MIRFSIEDGIRFGLKNRMLLKKWLTNVALEEKKRVGELSFIFCSDDYLLDINRRFLNHDYYTDVITFDYSEDSYISGDIFISLDTVRVNAEEFRQTFESELFRVMVHGVLHLCEYKDHSDAEKQLMRKKEDYYLAKLLYHFESSEKW